MPFLERVRHYLAEFRTEDGPAPAFSAVMGVEKPATGSRQTIHGINRLYQGTLQVFRGRSHDEMAGRLVSMIRDMSTEKMNSFIRIRAGGIRLNGGVLVLPSLPEKHLPALVALLVQRTGTAYVGDEMVMLDPVLDQAHALRLPLLVAAPDLSLLEGIEGSAARRTRKTGPTPRCPVRLEDLNTVAADPAEVSWIVFPEFQPGAETAFGEINQAEALFWLSRSVLNLHVWSDRALEYMRRLSSRVRVQRLTIGSMTDAVDVLTESADHG
jgi:hypothetical protein